MCASFPDLINFIFTIIKATLRETNISYDNWGQIFENYENSIILKIVGDMIRYNSN